MMDIIKPELSQFVKRILAVLMLFLLVSCVQNSEVQHQEVKKDTKPSMKYVYGDEIPCQPDTISYPVRNNRLFEDILDIYIDTENLRAKEDFIFVSSGCWTDSTYIVIMEHYKWNNPADSLIYLETGKVSSYRNIDIYLEIAQTDQFPIPNQLVVENKKVIDRLKEPFSPYNEYFNDIQIIYSPKENAVLEVLDKLGIMEISNMYKKLFREAGVMK